MLTVRSSGLSESVLISEQDCDENKLEVRLFDKQ